MGLKRGDWVKIVKNVAPALGAALGGPMAGVAVKVIADSVLGNQEATENEVENAILTASPDMLLALKEAENNFATRMKELDIDVFKIEAADKMGARGLFHVTIWPQIILSNLFILGYFTLLYGFVTGAMSLEEPIKDAALLLMGIITREVPTIMAFWFGSSFGSKEKSERLGRLGEV